MTFNVRRMLLRTGRDRAALKRLDPIIDLNRGPHPDLKPVLARHPTWRARLAKLLRVDPRKRVDLPAVREVRESKKIWKRVDARRRRKP